MTPSPHALDPHHAQPLLFQGYTVLLTNPDGSFDGSSGHQGLFHYDTRILSRYRLLLDDRQPECDSSGMIDTDRWMAHLSVARGGGTAAGPGLPQDVYELEIHRRVGDGMAEELLLRNHSMTPGKTTLVIELAADFLDIAQVDVDVERRGTIAGEWDDRAYTLTFDYLARDGEHRLHRAMRATITHADSKPVHLRRRLLFHIEVAPRASWRATIDYASLVDGSWRTPIPAARNGRTTRDAVRSRWRRERMHLETSEPILGGAFHTAAEDLFALRQWDDEETDDAWTTNAGVPTYTGLFGRDVLTAGWQAALIGPALMRGALARIATTQATEDSAWRDEEPGKMIHEARRGPLADLEITPRRAYYGTQTSSAMFVVALSELWHWTGDTEALARYRDAALRALEWADRYGDLDGDGFLEYRTRSPRGLRNHGWKDSDEAVRYPNGQLVRDPIATVEEQAYHVIALERMAEILTALDDEAGARDFLGRARRLRTRWHAAYWNEQDGFYAMALDGAKRQVRSVASNPGHALAAGIVPITHARRVADRLMAPDLFSGWGIRTLSADHPAYNPLAYHLGTVWPVENAVFVLGFKRYGLDGHVERLATASFAAAGCFRLFRLPEALGGHARDASPVATIYPRANSPQAWSASAVIQIVQALLGIYPFAPARLLALARPRLPGWVDTLTLRRLRVGDAVVSIRFERQSDGTAAHEVIEREGALHVIEVPPPQATELSWSDAMKTWLLDHAPGRMAAALRIAVGASDE